jgi:DNA-binding ferritin-like protein
VPIKAYLLEAGLMEKSITVGALYISSLKGMALIHQHSHWSTSGIAFYGDHLLFERLYNSALKDLDLAAEKFIGLFGDKVLDYDLQTDLLHKVLLKYNSLEGSPLEMSLKIEKDFLKLSQQSYKVFEDEETLTLGLDDMILSIASQREESVYLLQQALKGNTE